MPSKSPSKSPRKSSAKTTTPPAGTVTPVPLSLVGSELARLRATAPLTHCLTNEVVQGITANVLLALGASPAMIVAEEEVTAFAGIAGAVLVNVGTLYPERFAAMRRAAQAAQQAGTPWVLDPVAVGVLDYRTGAARELLAFQPAAIRGNASEILALAGFTGGGKGVDSTASADAAREAAEQLARDTGAIVAVTGETDYITDGEKTWAVPWGNPLMTRVVGTGCALSAVVAAFCAGATNRLDAVAAACAVMAICGEVATGESHGPGSFTPAFLDALYLIQPEQLARTVNA
ncbi:hydroxyethylthiazole kinase [Jeongeupia chitinilytica]|uniref:Hydroxyethylthiazole kinase n=1 Tax=Jeongeupia chitinilytica TaxID=1041641 RepID=A0ABQ3H2F5_9NEIS|nr:hydroxyethylthiazole kinase [Jeongeupia chitinilytica]GHD62407.1 hydroxyethylthiazole kinase [Jeongeupia chitinilytica]